jgi:hypothetical protein
MKICNNFFFASETNTFHISYVESKNQFRAKKYFRLSRGVVGDAGVAGVAGVAVGFWTRFEAQLAQPC